jgi:hypothetical protein
MHPNFYSVDMYSCIQLTHDSNYCTISYLGVPNFRKTSLGLGNENHHVHKKVLQGNMGLKMTELFSLYKSITSYIRYWVTYNLLSPVVLPLFGNKLRGENRKLYINCIFVLKIGGGGYC